MQIKWVCGILKSTIKNPRNVDLDGNIKLHYQKVCRDVQTCFEMTPTFLDKNTFLCRNCTAQVESFCVEIACVELTDTLDT